MSYSKSLTDWGQREFPRVKSRRSQRASGIDSSYLAKLQRTFGNSIVGLWPQNEAGGVSSLDIGGRNHPGIYANVTLGATGIGDGNTAATYNGTTSKDNIYSAGLNTDFNNQELTVGVWGQITSAGVWSDATVRFLLNLQVDASNQVLVEKTATAGQLQVRYIAGATTKLVSVASGSPLTPFFIGMTVSKSGDAMKCYFGNAQSGATQTGLGVWAGSLLSTSCCIGAQNTTPTAVWSGVIGPVLLLNRAATAAEIAIAATVP